MNVIIFAKCLAFCSWIRYSAGDVLLSSHPTNYLYSVTFWTILIIFSPDLASYCGQESMVDFVLVIHRKHRRNTKTGILK